MPVLRNQNVHAMMSKPMTFTPVNNEKAKGSEPTVSKLLNQIANSQRTMSVADRQKLYTGWINDKEISAYINDNPALQEALEKDDAWLKALEEAKNGKLRITARSNLSTALNNLNKFTQVNGQSVSNGGSGTYTSNGTIHFDLNPLKKPGSSGSIIVNLNGSVSVRA
ncbi:hypothetical protein [Vreelandella titanicae]|uniref:hypothetical protein n=1 Tax=Vreelandella titanicae TaxID=664683 RepID=UPI0016800E0D|nr:hypothetical protein [Halomonas titanicae]QNU61364.1 hypothetical protein HZS52_16515 [Halomonas titanicae]